MKQQHVMLCASQVEQAARRAAEARLADAVAQRASLDARLAAKAAANAQQAALMMDSQVCAAGFTQCKHACWSSMTGIEGRTPSKLRALCKQGDRLM